MKQMLTSEPIESMADMCPGVLGVASINLPGKDDLRLKLDASVGDWGSLRSLATGVVINEDQ